MFSVFFFSSPFALLMSVHVFVCICLYMCMNFVHCSARARVLAVVASTFTRIRYDHYMTEFSLFSIHATHCWLSSFGFLATSSRLIEICCAYQYTKWNNSIYIVLQQFKFSYLHCCVCICAFFADQAHYGQFDSPIVLKMPDKYNGQTNKKIKRNWKSKHYKRVNTVKREKTPI